MAISSEQSILNILKVYYKDGVSNLLFRNSPAVRQINKTRVEGKEQRFAAMYGRGGAVASKFTVALNKAANNSKNAEFIVTPGQLFSVFTYNAKEVQASKSKKGAYMKVAGNKAFAAAEALRKTLAAAFYGRGFGEVGVLDSTAAAVIAAGTAGTDVEVELTRDIITKIAVDSDLVLKTSVSSGTENGLFTVKKINGTKVTLTVGTAYASAAAGDVICLRGSMDASGNPNMPMGLDGWLPIVNARVNGAADTNWDDYIETPFYNVNRSLDVESLAGSFIYDTNNTKKVDDIQQLLQVVRDHGSMADFLVMNSKDWLDVANEIQSTNTYFTQTSTKAKRMANVGLSEMSASFSTNDIQTIIDDPYCPKGKFYILEKDDVELWAYTNSEVAQEDGIAGNEPGTQDPLTYNDKGEEDSAFKLLIDDFISVVPGTPTDDGEAVRVTYNLFGSFVLMNPAHAGVGIFHDYTAADVVGYAK